jgi:guanine deaminase
VQSIIMRDLDQQFMRRAIELAELGLNSNTGGPFGAVVVFQDKIIGEGCNRVTTSNDPTAHAEVVAIRAACEHLSHFQLHDCTIYTSCEPCPMCLGAIYWARPSRVLFGCNHADAAAIGFDDHFIYEELQRSLGERRIPMENFLRQEALRVFELWTQKTDKKEY